MLGRVIVLPEKDYETWKNRAMTGTQSTPRMTPVERGRQVYETRGCKACHSTDGSEGVAPTFLGLYGHSVELEGGETVLADENYLRESILDPQRKVVKGYQPVMPPFQGILSEEEVDALIAFIRSLGKEEGE
jgi:cytochrome c oxidase subunit 2